MIHYIVRAFSIHFFLSSCVQGYTKLREFVVTEWPLKAVSVCSNFDEDFPSFLMEFISEHCITHTLTFFFQSCGEFWSLLYDHEISAVVVLCQPPTNSVSLICHAKILAGAKTNYKSFSRRNYKFNFSFLSQPPRVAKHSTLFHHSGRKATVRKSSVLFLP